MAFGNLTKLSGGELHAEGTSVPVNGNNTFSHGIDARHIIGYEDFVEIRITPQGGGSVTGASFVSWSADRTQITVNFVQTGADAAKLRFKQTHSIAR